MEKDGGDILLLNILVTNNVYEHYGEERKHVIRKSKTLVESMYKLIISSEITIKWLRIQKRPK